MIPRLHPRGKGFKGACTYVLHDAGKAETSDRVAWVMAVNLATKDPNWAWHEMTETAYAQGTLKLASGSDGRGRKNTEPVLHYSLAWAEEDNPTPESMKQAALDSLKALGLGEHEALIAAHQDKRHLHVHIVVNTIHPRTGMTAQLKFTQLSLSHWAEAYENEHGIHCTERIKNNADREQAKQERSRCAATNLLMGKAPQARHQAVTAAERRALREVPYVKDRSPHRKIWIDRKDIIDRMRRMRAEQEVLHKVDRKASWDQHKQERQRLWQDSKTGLVQAQEYVAKAFRPHWRALYKAQKEEFKFLEKASPLEKAVFVFKNRERLGHGKPLSARDIHRAIASPGRLLDLIQATHKREKTALAQIQKAEAHVYTSKVLDDFARKHNELLSRQTDERQAERVAQFIETRKVTFDDARQSLIEDLAHRFPARKLVRNPPPAVGEQFAEAAHDYSLDPLQDLPISRADEIKRDMEQWRKRHRGPDSGREM